MSCLTILLIYVQCFVDEEAVSAEFVRAHVANFIHIDSVDWILFLARCDFPLVFYPLCFGGVSKLGLDVRELDEELLDLLVFDHVEVTVSVCCCL